MIIPVCFVAWHRVDIDVMDAVENAFFDIRIIPFLSSNRRLDLLSLGTAASVIADRAVFRKPARTLDKL